MKNWPVVVLAYLVGALLAKVVAGMDFGNFFFLVALGGTLITLLVQGMKE